MIGHLSMQYCRRGECSWYLLSSVSQRGARKSEQGQVCCGVKHVLLPTKMTSACRRYLTSSSRPISLRRSYLYVPAASERMLEKSLETESDVWAFDKPLLRDARYMATLTYFKSIIYDLEDSVALPDKYNARKRLVNFLSVRVLLLNVDVDCNWVLRR